ncbi:Hypothetical protein AJAP_42870 (plasmid) [Amycolatopsis japonica]|uniref:Uncharacterized protein n=1 Tax=Amycolatopsis japonica TaxID=208439 RepID=A0A075VAH8_9PSEU|nr:hypothetical protein [Amycolatopsis japonica]AIG81341.1 Hypothetical protein AJAP_42870 [Amycolatopsis japonica]
MTEPILGRVFELDVPLVLPPQPRRRGGKAVNRTRPQKLCPYNLNWKLHWAKHAEHKRVIAEAVTWRARAARIPKADHLTVQLHWAPGDNTSADTDNLAASAKPAYDALARPTRKTTGAQWTGLQLVPDDSPRYMTKLGAVIHPGPQHTRRLWLTVQIGCVCCAGGDHQLEEDRAGE